MIRRCNSGLLKDYCQFIGNSDQTLAWILVMCITSTSICMNLQSKSMLLPFFFILNAIVQRIEQHLRSHWVIIWYIVGNMSPYEVNSAHSVSNSWVFSQSSWPPSLHGDKECCHAAEGKGPQLEPSTHWTFSKGLT